jgi:hypothetical protein
MSKIIEHTAEHGEPEKGKCHAGAVPDEDECLKTQLEQGKTCCARVTIFSVGCMAMPE